MRAIILSRKSKHQPKNVHSRMTEEQMTRDYAHKNNLDVQHEYLVNRPYKEEHFKALQVIINEIQASQEPIALIVPSIFRLTRNVKEGVMLDDLCKQGKVELHCVRENLILSKSSDRSNYKHWKVCFLFVHAFQVQMRKSLERRARTDKLTCR